ncbi:hypothetical protein PHK61_30980 [Actinomycetospora lutea]|uniref:hypothetical protein n=1 Tax=Actinomycetospora lutea TaxID=663604 RepID=UPI0023668934|nr:hypothetical protein [Actinomycetospora lutea]MDD7942846.1 hypothetical protein [Actinomycetospora lutea]
MLADHAERFAAGRKHRDPGAAADDVHDERGRLLDHVLAVVQHQQQLLGAQVLDEPGGRRQAGALCDPQRGAHGVDHGGGVADRGQLDQGRAVRELARPQRSRMPREQGLADAAGAHERHEPGSPQRPPEFVEVVRPPDQGRQRGAVLSARLRRLLGGLLVRISGRRNPAPVVQVGILAQDPPVQLLHGRRG